MARYHKKVYWKEDANDKLKAFTDVLNCKKWGYTEHSLDRIKTKNIDITRLLLWIKGLRLDEKNIFEYYEDDITKNVLKAVYRINWVTGIDIVLVISDGKILVTVYDNESEDLHYTLNTGIYNKA